MNISDNSTYIERQAESTPFLDHEEAPQKCGICTKNLIRYEVAKEFKVQGKISDDYIKEYEKVCEDRWRESLVYKEVMKLTKSGLTLDEAIAQLEKQGYHP